MGYYDVHFDFCVMWIIVLELCAVRLIKGHAYTYVVSCWEVYILTTLQPLLHTFYEWIMILMIMISKLSQCQSIFVFCFY